jgi:ceramide glucosyltransferase
MIQWVLVILVIVSWVYCLVSLWLTWTFFRHAQDRHSDFTPPVSILKAVKDVDAEEYENFASFCRQDYPEYELLFGVANASDPVIGVVKRLQRDFPERHIRLVVHQPEHLNRKASMLEELSKLARYDVLAASDSDMRVSRDYLRRVVAPLKDEHVGLVTCPYRADRPFTFTARLEALHMGVTFLPYVMVGRKFLNMRFALGSTNVLRRADLERIGGFAAVADFLADDYQLGKQIAQTGLSVYLSDYIMISVLGPTTFE